MLFLQNFEKTTTLSNAFTQKQVIPIYTHSNSSINQIYRIETSNSSNDDIMMLAEFN